MSDQLDYQIKAARVGRIYLEGCLLQLREAIVAQCLLQLREAIVAQWLLENRHNPRQGDIDAELTLYRLHRKEECLGYAEYLIERYATE